MNIPYTSSLSEHTRGRPRVPRPDCLLRDGDMLLGNAQEHPVTVLRIRTFLGLLDPDPDPLVRGMDPDPSITKQKLQCSGSGSTGST
jgi:hypothetical protein